MRALAGSNQNEQLAASFCCFCSQANSPIASRNLDTAGSQGQINLFPLRALVPALCQHVSYDQEARTAHSTQAGISAPPPIQAPSLQKLATL
eukprot:scaffold225883_cov17-Tisochrysis_lutea.AAC.1